MIIRDLHKSITEMSEDEIIAHIREIRALRRQIPEKKARKTKTKTKGAKTTKKPTVKEHLGSLNDIERKILLERLLSLKEK